VDSGKSAKFKKFSYAIIAVGSLNVNNITIDCLQGKKYVKGAYAGHFSVGSTVILCFDKTLGKYSKLLMQDGQKTAIGENIFKINSI
jgi:phosphatidylserine decarboxylase